MSSMDTRYLFRYNTWWVKVAVPKNLRDELGYDLRRSLKTHELEKAQELRWQVVEQLKSKINEAKQIETFNETVDSSLKAVVNYVPPTNTQNPQYYHKVVDCQHACQLILLYRSIYARYLKEIIMMLICLIGSRMCSQGYLEEHAIDLV